MAIIAACRAAEARVLDLCERFGRELYMAACDALLERTKGAGEGAIVFTNDHAVLSFAARAGIAGAQAGIARAWVGA